MRSPTRVVISGTFRIPETPPPGVGSTDLLQIRARSEPQSPVPPWLPRNSRRLPHSSRRGSGEAGLGRTGWSVVLGATNLSVSFKTYRPHRPFQGLSASSVSGQVDELGSWPLPFFLARPRSRSYASFLVCYRSGLRGLNSSERFSRSLLTRSDEVQSQRKGYRTVSRG